ncbi:MAG: formylglycine-generating enzyme family protein [Magnetococcus sp. DMHC-6]
MARRLIWIRALFFLIFFIEFYAPIPAEAFLINEWEPLTLASKPTEPTPNPATPGSSWQESKSGMNFLWIKEGCFKMGSPPKIQDRDSDEGPVHEVCLPGFWLASTEITQEQWRLILREIPANWPAGRLGEHYPVTNVSITEIETLLDKLNQSYAGQLFFRLPTEAEWEYACRDGGMMVSFPNNAFPNTIGWNVQNSAGASHPVATRAPSRLGLFDMSGNVWEWTQDLYQRDAYATHARTSPSQAGTGLYRVIRGGGWDSPTDALRCANRGFELLTKKRPNLGLRLAIQVDHKKSEERPKLKDLPF